MHWGWFRLIYLHDPINRRTIDPLYDPAWPSDLDVGDLSFRAQPEVHPPIAG
jgi:hypothetical protein